MAMKEHPFVVTTTFQGDGETIKYDPTQPGRSDAVGKAFRINEEGKGVLVADGEEIDGKVLEVDDDHKFTGAYMCGGLLFPIGENQTVKRGDKLVGALGPSNAKGYVKAVGTPAALPADLADLAAADIDTDAEKLTVHNAARTAINSVSATVGDLVEVTQGKGNVLEVDTTHALAAFGS